MNSLLNWLDDRTGYRDFVHEALYENVPGGARWRYVWGSTLVFTFTVQMITGFFLWMAYSPSTQTAWESVYYIEHHMSQGWLLRGIHHYTAWLMVILLALHLLQVVIDGAYRAPREVNFWLGIILMQIVLALALTGYLLPWDQKGYWATQVATKIAGILPVIGPWLQRLIVGGAEYGHHTLTRFFALHAGVLPALLVFFLVLHVALFRRHGIKAKIHPERDDQHFWPDQVLKDAVACLAVLVCVGLLMSYFGRAELGAPADPANAYDAARPEWYFLFLFQFLKFFHGETGDLVGAVVLPSLVMLVLVLMPIVGRWRVGHYFNVCFLALLLIGAGVLTGLALHEDYQAKWAAKDFDDVSNVLSEIDLDLKKNEKQSKYRDHSKAERIAIYFGDDAAKAAVFLARLKQYEAYLKSQHHIAAVHEAHVEAQRAAELSDAGIPPSGALALVRDDRRLEGRRLFRTRCAICHNFQDRGGQGGDNLGLQSDIVNPEPTAPNLHGFGSREWVAGMLDPEQIVSRHYFGYRGSKLREDDMVGWVNDNVRDLKSEAEKERRVTQLKQVAAALSAEAGLPGQAKLDASAAAEIATGRELIKGSELGCTDCHKFHDAGDLGSAPDLTGYGSREWLREFISNPAHERFYSDKNDGMPAFAEHPDDSEKNLLDARSLGLVIDWLRGESDPASAD